MTPYTYLIGWTEHNMWYYGVRYSEHSDPSDLWTKYFTSSVHVKEFRKQYGEPDVIEVRKTFDDAESAVLWESKVLKRLKVKEKDYFLNRNDGAAPPVMKGEANPFYGKKHDERVLEILRRDKTEEAKSNMRKPKSKTPSKSEEHKKKIGLAKKGVGHSEEIFKILSQHSQKYEYLIENIHTGEIHKTTNLLEFCEGKPGCDQRNLSKTANDGHKGKTYKQSGGYRVVQKIEMKKKVLGAKLRDCVNNVDFVVDDLRAYCKENNVDIHNLRRTSDGYKGKNKSYTCKGLKVIEYFET